MVESEAFELHPVSNEIEFQDVYVAGYRRLDVETLHARVDVADLGLTVIYLWCVGDSEGGGDGWRVAEVLPLLKGEEETIRPEWKTSIAETGEASRQEDVSRTPAATGAANGTSAVKTNGVSSNPAIDGAATDDNDNDDDDDYWAQYDNAPTSTPGPQPSPGPPADAQPPRHGRTMSDAAYYSQYAHVQPDMDNDDPSTDRTTIGESSLNGATIPLTSQLAAAPAPSSQPNETNHPTSPSKSKPSPPTPSQPPTTTTKTTTPKHYPRPRTTTSLSPSPSSPPSSSSSALIDRLEDSANMQSQTELAVRQHVASTMKSLRRLARSTGMGTPEFEALVGREVEMLRFEEEEEGMG